MSTTLVPENWRKSSYSGPNNCVEIADSVSGVAVRDSQSPVEGHLSFTTSEWHAFIEAIHTGEL